MIAFALKGKLGLCNRNDLACKASNVYYMSVYRKCLLIMVYVVLHNLVRLALNSPVATLPLVLTLLPQQALYLLQDQGWCFNAQGISCSYSSLYRKCSFLGSLIGRYFFIIQFSPPQTEIILEVLYKVTSNCSLAHQTFLNFLYSTYHSQ